MFGLVVPPVVTGRFTAMTGHTFTTPGSEANSATEESDTSTVMPLNEVLNDRVIVTFRPRLLAVLSTDCWVDWAVEAEPPSSVGLPDTWTNHLLGTASAPACFLAVFT